MYKNISEKSIYDLKKHHLVVIVKLVFKKSEGKLMKKCPKCGAFVGKTQAKCRNCGCDLLSPEPVKKVVQPKVEAPKPAPQVEAKPAPTPAPIVKPAGKVLVAKKVEGVIEIVICPRCGGKNAASASYCSHCGQKLGVLKELQEEKKEEPKLVKCPHCEKDNVEDAVYCAYCGKSLVEEPVPEVVSEPEPVEEPVEETPVVDEVETTPIAVEEAEVKEEQPIEIEEVSTNVEEEKKEEEKKPLVPFTKLSRLSVILMLVATMILGVLPILTVNVNSLGGFDNAFMGYIDAFINFNTSATFSYINTAVWFLLPMVVCAIYAIVAFGMLIFNIVKGFDKYRNYSTLFAPTVAFAFYFIMITAGVNVYSWNFFFSASLWPNMVIAILIILATILGIVANVLRKVERKNANLLSTQAIIKTVFGYVSAAIVIAGIFLMFTDAYFVLSVTYFMQQNVTSTTSLDVVPFIFGAVNSIIVPIFMGSATQSLIGLSTDGVRYRSAIAGASLALASYVIILVGAIVTNSISNLAIVTYVFLALSVIILVASSVLGYFKRKEDNALLQEYVE